MILNRFSNIPASGRLMVLSFKLCIISLFSCNKTSNISANKAFVSFTHVAYNVDSLTLRIGGNTVFSSIPFDSATGHPYATVTSQISNTTILEHGVDSFLSGFSSFRQGAYYSIYVYDTLSPNPSAKSMIILQDNPPLNADTAISVRYMNFTPSSKIGLLLVNTRHGSMPVASDTFIISPAVFVGANINPAAYTFQPILAGNYDVTAFADSTSATGSIFRSVGNWSFSITSNYNFLLTGFGNLDSGQNKFQFKPVALN
jgi:hypothetical protein